MRQAKGGKPKVASLRLRTKTTSGRDRQATRCTSPQPKGYQRRMRKPGNLPLRLSSRLGDILIRCHSIDLYTEVGKARNNCNTTASNSIWNTDRHGAPPVRHRVLFALPKPKACSALGADGKLKGRRLSLAT